MIRDAAAHYCGSVHAGVSISVVTSWRACERPTELPTDRAEIPATPGPRVLGSMMAQARRVGSVRRDAWMASDALGLLPVIFRYLRARSCR